MEDGTPSETARMVAAMRAHHYNTTPEPRILSDNLAGPLAGFADAAAVADYLGAMTERLASLGNRAAAIALITESTQRMCIRSRLVEEQLAILLGQGARQLVVLGAGMDSLAYRRPELTKKLKVYEVDLPATQAWKRAQLAAVGATIPDNLTFVPFDFERQTLAQALEAGGVDKNAITMFSWLGVQYYLTEDAVMSTLRVMAGFAPGSQLVMDLATPDDANVDSDTADGIRQFLAVVASMGEPFHSRFTAEDFSERLRALGFGEIAVDRCTAGSATLERFRQWSPYLVPMQSHAGSCFITATVG